MYCSCSELSELCDLNQGYKYTEGIFYEIFTEIILRTYAAVEALIRCINYPLYLLQELRTKKKYLPPIKDKEILCKSATYLANKIRSGELKSEDVVKTYIKRIKEVNPHLNAVVENRFKDAINEAKAVDKLVASKRKTAKHTERDTPFLGVPITVKESCKVKGMSFCVGSLIRKGIKASKDGEAVKNLRDSGAIILAVTTTPEWCCSCETDNLVTGKTLNPNDQLRTPGGSSGGEAALISCAASVCGIGSDIAGSIRVPALSTGIFGHKPTPGYIAIDDHFPVSSDPMFRKCLVIGPMCRYSEDLVPMMKVMANNKATKLRLDDKINIKNVKVMYALESGSTIFRFTVDKDIKDSILKAVSYLKEAHGATTIPVKIKELGKSMEISLCRMFSMKTLPDVLKYPDNPKESYNCLLEMLKAMIGWSQFSLQALFVPLLKLIMDLVPKTVFANYEKQGEELEKKFSEILGTNGVLIYPTQPAPAMYHGESYGKMSGSMYTLLFNVLGMPSTHVPMGFGSSGLPIGFQVVAAPHQDRLCLAVAKVLEEGFGGWVPPPSSPSST